MPAPDLVLAGAVVRTMDPANPVAEAIAVRDGRIAAVGRDDDVRALAGSATEVRELGGATVLPGFIDAHNHHALAGRAELFELVLPAEASYDAILDAVRAFSADLAPDAWLVGGSWPSTLVDRLSTGEPARQLDAAAGGRPVLLGDDSHHNRWVSTRALELAGIRDDTSDPVGGRIVRDGGVPTGLLFEAAGAMVEQARSEHETLTAAQHRDSSAAAIRRLHGFGITAFQDAGATLEIMGGLRDLDAAGELRAWVSSCLLVNDLIFGADPVGDALLAHREEFRSRHHRPDFVKIFLDGVPPTRTGAFLEPYLPDDEHGALHRGALTMSPDELRDWLLRSAGTGFSAKIHCTGDRAVRAALDAVAAVRAAGHHDPIYHVAHGQFVDDADLPRFAELDVVADISPFLWVPGVIPDAIATVLPAGRAARMQPNRSLLDAGARIAGGSDWPVSETPDPIEAIAGLVTRRDPRGVREGSLGPEQAVTIDEAVAMFTSAAAAAIGYADETGALRAGLSADLVVLADDPWRLPPEHLLEAAVAQTWFAGEQVHG